MTTYRLISLVSLLWLVACSEDNVECRAASDCVVDGHICLDNRCQDYPLPDDNRTPVGGGIGGTEGDTGAAGDTGGTDAGADAGADTGADASSDTVEDVAASCLDLTVSPSRINLGSNNPGEDISDTFQILNTGSLPITLSSVFTPPPFNIRSPSRSQFPIQIAGGQSVTATVALVAGSGSQSGTIDIVTNVCAIDVSVRGSAQ